MWEPRLYCVLRRSDNLQKIVTHIFSINFIHFSNSGHFDLIVSNPIDSATSGPAVDFCLA